MRRWIVIAGVGAFMSATANSRSVQLIGFEEYLLGSIDGQQGWTSTSIVEPQVADLHPAWGQKHLRLTNDESLPSGWRIEAVGPAAHFPPHVNWAFLYGAISFQGFPQSTYEVLSLGREGSPTAGLRFAPDHQIFALADIGHGPEFVSTGHAWIESYASFWIELWPDRGIHYQYNGTVILEAMPIGSSTAANIVLASDNHWPSPGECMDVDEIGYGWIPEPSVASLLPFGALLARRR